MNGSPNIIHEERLSFKDLYLELKNWIKYLLSNWKQLILSAAVIFLVYFSYSMIRKPVYAAETTLVVEGSEMELGGSISSLASIAGFDIGGLGSGSALFQTENILELYASRKMLREAFLATGLFNGKPIRLIERYAEYTGLREKWDNDDEVSGISFNLPLEELTIKHDSLLFEVIEKFKEKNLVVEKPSRQLTIISIKVFHKDQLFAKYFNEAIVEKVNDFYRTTKTLKTAENLSILQRQTDSVKHLLNQQLAELAEVDESQPNLNPLVKTPYAQNQKLQIEVKTSGAAYEQLVTNLEMAKISHRNNSPLIQLIDEPMLPLPNDKLILWKLVVYSFILGGGLAFFAYSIKYVFIKILNE